MQQSRIRDRITGLDTVEYKEISRHRLTIEGAPVTIIGVHLHCDLDMTSWCITPDQLRLYKAGQLSIARSYIAGQVIEKT